MALGWSSLEIYLLRETVLGNFGRLYLKSLRWGKLGVFIVMIMIY